jgi:hypothetical protein
VEWTLIVVVLIVIVRALLPHRRAVILFPEAKSPAAVGLDGHFAIEA